MEKKVPIGISLPNEFIKEIDKDRKDISRSRYLLRLLESSYTKRDLEKSSLDTSPAKATPSESLR